MANYYYNNETSDALWDTVANWFLDSDYLIPAGSLPTPSDDVFIDGELTTGPSVAVSLASITCGSILTSPFNVNLGNATTGGSYEFYNNVTHTGTSVVGGYYFYDNSINSGGVDSNNVSGGFFDSSENSGTAYSIAEFNNNSTNTGTCDSTASFSDSSHNLGTVISTATFNDLSYNTGTILGNATFATFADLGSGRYEDVLGYGIGIVGGDVEGSGSELYTIAYETENMTGNITATTDNVNVDFQNATYNAGNIDIIGSVAFSDTSYNIGTIQNNAIFVYTTAVNGIVNDITGYASGTVNGAIYDSTGTALISSWRFTTTNLLSGGVCDGNAIFKNTSVNRGTVTGNAYFDIGCVKKSLSAGNIGTIGGTVFLPFADILGTGLQ